MAALESDQTSPLLTITGAEKGGVLLIVAAIALTLAVVSVGVRGYVRFRLRPQRLSWDDGFIGIALFIFILQSAVVFWEGQLGLGMPISEVTNQKIINIQKGLYIDNIFFILSVWTSKISVAFLLLRLSLKRIHFRSAQISIGFIIATGITALLLICVRCDLTQPWIMFDRDGRTCSRVLSRWYAVAAFDILTEVVLICTAGLITHLSQISTTRKSIAFLAFGQRLALVAAIGLRLKYLIIADNSSDPTFRIVFSTICKQAEICYAIVGATIPILQSSMSTILTDYGAPGGQGRASSPSSPNINKKPKIPAPRKLLSLFSRKNKSSIAAPDPQTIHRKVTNASTKRTKNQSEKLPLGPFEQDFPTATLRMNSVDIVTGANGTATKTTTTEGYDRSKTPSLGRKIRITISYGMRSLSRLEQRNISESQIATAV